MKNLVLSKNEAKLFREKVSELLIKIDLGLKDYVANNHEKAITRVQFSVLFKYDKQVVDYVKQLLIRDYGWEGAVLNRDEDLLYISLPW
jgi:hypothetical protein